MKPDRPTKDRDILRARCAKQLKPPAQPPTQSPAHISEPSPSSSSELPSTSEGGGVPVPEGQGGGGAEMRVYLDKLRELVPYVPRSGRVSRVTLIHSAIDYITDLQEALEARARRKLRDKSDPASRPPLAALPQAQHQPNTAPPPSPPSGLRLSDTNRLTDTRHPAAPSPLDSNLLLSSEVPSSSSSYSTNSFKKTPDSSFFMALDDSSSSHSSSSSKSPVLPAAPGPPRDPG